MPRATPTARAGRRELIGHALAAPLGLDNLPLATDTPFAITVGPASAAPAGLVVAKGLTMRRL